MTFTKRYKNPLPINIEDQKIDKLHNSNVYEDINTILKRQIIYIEMRSEFFEDTCLIVEYSFKNEYGSIENFTLIIPDNYNAYSPEPNSQIGTSNISIPDGTRYRIKGTIKDINVSVVSHIKNDKYYIDVVNASCGIFKLYGPRGGVAAFRKNIQDNLYEDQDEDDKLFSAIVITDLYGCNLGEMACKISSNKLYPNGYSIENVGENLDIQFNINNSGNNKITLYTARPKLEKVLCGKISDTLLKQTNRMNKKYKIEISNTRFFEKILEYSTLKYFLAGLIFNVFDLKWLLKKYHKCFLKKLKHSEFKEYLIIFTNTDQDTGYVGYENYFRCHDYNVKC